MKAQRRIIVYIATSADGYIAMLDGDVEWLNRRPRTGRQTLLFDEPVFRLSAGFAIQGLVLDEYVQLRPPITLLHMQPHLVLIATS